MRLKLAVFDVDTEGRNEIGHCEISLPELVSKASIKGFEIELESENHEDCGYLILKIDEIYSAHSFYTFNL